ncbi:MAG: efflux RND transporter periplasmic adaptor subunit, partial [Bacteroidales bacterium]|nr:efflux RND transporter periplasmic adaptor subunit [Bacteroidales bacterium]
MNRNIHIIIYLFFVFFSSCKQKIDRDLFSIPVEIKVVNLHADTLYQTYIGEIKEEYSSSLSFSVPGNVERIYVNEGEYVNKGTLLASLDKENLQSTYDASLAMLKQAEDAYNRLHKLYEKGSLPEIQWMEMLTNLEKARSAEKIAKKNLAESNLYAPFSGIIGKKNIEMGMYAMPSISAITLLNTNNVVVKVPIPENVI